MERLILLRHGKAEHDSESGDDFDRRLAPKGVEDIGAMARHLADMGFKADCALVSSAVRTRETWEAASPAFRGATVSFRPDFYNADAMAIRLAAEKAGGDCKTLIVVGHNPGLQELTVRLLIEGSAPSSIIARASRSFPPASSSVFLIDPNGRPMFDGLFFPEP